MPDPLNPSRRERFETQVLVHMDAGYNLARWILRDGDTAQDAVQDACLRAYRYFDTMNGTTPKAWFIAIVRNACVDSMNRERREVGQVSYEEELHAQPARDSEGEIDSPESQLMRLSDMRQLSQRLAELPWQYREVLVMREMEDLSYREISVAVGVPIGTVMSRLSRARARLAQLLRADPQMKAVS